ncbi:MAG: GNAT family N-acetyltransferase [Actinobacteria bacterium]|nr:GNAT family N-acetyltransferase [Actinomycetota bacterium]
MRSEFTIRDAVIEDAPAIARVNYLTQRHAFRGLIPNLELDSLDVEFLTGQWNQNLSLANPRSSTYVVINGESLIAYSRFYPSIDPDDDQDRVATIGSMYVNPDFQGIGVGRELMKTVLKAAKELAFREATLHVLVANKRAREFYENLGWKRDMEADIGGSGEATGSKVRYRKSLL